MICHCLDLGHLIIKLTDLVQTRMQQDIQNIPPNYEEPQLADIIRENINFQIDQSVKRTLLKESLLKISLDKDFQHLFQNNRSQPPKLSPHHNQPNHHQKHLVSVSQQIKEICSWLQDSEQHRGMAYLPFQTASRLIQILHQKVEGTTIIISQYPQFWLGKMQEMSRLCKLRWGLLSEEQDGDDKIKVLELYELKKLKILFITPNLFKSEEYHQFQCDLLIILDLHLYLSDSKYISQIINKTTPGRVLALYHTLMPLHYQSIAADNKIIEINQPRVHGFNFIVLRTSAQQKFRTMMAYLSKNQFKKVLIVVRKKQQASFLNKKLLLESKTSINLFEELSSKEINGFNPQSMLKHQQNKIDQKKIFQVLKKVSHSDIVLCKNTDFLRFCNFDIAVYFSFNDVISFAESCFTVKQKLLLFEQTDYCDHRNWITSDLVTMESLQRLVMRLLQRQAVKQANSKKRYYSDYIEDKLMNSFTVNKEFMEKDIQKVVRINAFCKKHEITQHVLLRLIDSLQASKVVGINYRTAYEIQIDAQSLSRMKKEFPLIEQIRRKVNLLNISTRMQKTIRSILQDFNKQGIKYKITEQAVQMKLLQDYEQIDWEQLYQKVNQDICQQVSNLDKSFEILKTCVYSSIELTRREKILHKKQYMLNFFAMNEGNRQSLSTMQSYHKSNLLMSQVEEWIRVSEQVCIDEQQLLLLLQGVDKGRVSRFKEDAIFGRYRRLKYEQLMQTIVKIYSNKRIKGND